MRSSLSILIFLLIFAGVGGIATAIYGDSLNGSNFAIWLGAFVLAVIASQATNVAGQWEKAAVLRLGKFRAMKGPGLFFIIPTIEAVPYWIDTRVITASVNYPPLKR